MRIIDKTGKLSPGKNYNSTVHHQHAGDANAAETRGSGHQISKSKILLVII